MQLMEFAQKCVADCTRDSKRANAKAKTRNDPRRRNVSRRVKALDCLPFFVLVFVILFLINFSVEEISENVKW